MKILMLNYEWPPIGGGAGKAHWRIANEFADRNDVIVDVLTSGPRPGFFKEKLAENITVYKTGIHKKDLHFWRKMEVLSWLWKAHRRHLKMLRKTQYDLAHAFFGFPTGLLPYMTAGKIPYIISLRGSDVPGRHDRLQLEYKLLGPLFRRIWRRASAVVACSNGLRDRAHQFLADVPIEVIPNGVDLDVFKPAPSRRKGDELRLVTVGRLSGTKRFDMLIDMMDVLRNWGRKPRLVIAGGGGMLGHLQRMVSEKHLQRIIELPGRVEGEWMPEIYRQSDIFVSASIQEGMSNAMLEAMASGLPIITTRCEGVEELIKDNGIVVEYGNAAALAQAVTALADDKERLAAMHAAARSRAEQFGWKAVADCYIDLYRRVIDSRGGR